MRGYIFFIECTLLFKHVGVAATDVAVAAVVGGGGGCGGGCGVFVVLVVLVVHT
jgi:hypothetical protein